MDQRLRRYKRGKHASVDTTRNLGVLVFCVIAVIVLSISMVVATNIGAAGNDRSAVEAAGLQGTSSAGQTSDPARPDTGTDNTGSEPSVESVALTDEQLPGELSVEPGQLRSLEIKDSEGETRRYLLSVPDGYDPLNPAPTPLTFVFHGKGASPEGFIEGSMFKTAVVTDSLIVLPEGKDASWGGAPYATTSIDQDVDLVTGLIDELDAHYNVDRSRVYGIGFSNGGGMVANLACRAPDEFAGLAMVAGAFYAPIFENCMNRGAAVMTVHGTDDATIPYEGGEKFETQFYSVLSATERYAKRNGCSILSENLEDLPLNQIAIFEGCLYETQHVRIPGGRHVWPKDVPTAEKIWDFLSRQHIPA